MYWNYFFKKPESHNNITIKTLNNSIYKSIYKSNVALKKFIWLMKSYQTLVIGT